MPLSTTFFETPGEQLRIAEVHQREDHVGVNVLFGQSAPSIPDATFNTLHTSGGTIINANTNVDNRVHYNYYGVPPATSFNPIHPRAPFNDAPVDRISPCFVGRDEELQLCANVLGLCDGDTPSRYAVWGMPGLGKSQLALKYANTSFRAGRHTHIIWISATTMEKVNQGLAGVLDLLQHPDRHHTDQVARITAARLCLEHSQQYGFLKWLIIFDDVTVATVPFLRESLPRQNSHGSILFTTRTADIAQAMTSVAGEQHPVHRLNALSLEESTVLLLTRAGINSSTAADVHSAHNLVRRIGCLPLAVEQAGSYMKRGGLTSAGQLEMLYDQRGLAEVIGWNNSLSSYQEKSVLTTFAVQFQRLGEIDPNFLRLLKVLAFFDPESIPLDIIVLGAGMVGRHLDVSKSTVLLTTQGTNRQNQPLFFIPPNTDVDVASEVVSAELRHLLGLICSETWLRGAHAGTPTAELLVMGQQVARYFQQRGRYDEAEALYRQALAGLEQQLGTYHPDTLRTANGLAYLYYTQGRYGQAEVMYQRVLAGQEQLSADHAETLRAVNGLAALYNMQGYYTEAESFYRRALAGMEQQLGADHPDTLKTANNLAWVYTRQGNYVNATALCQRALVGQQQQLGADHPETLSTVHNFAVLHMEQGKYAEAETLYQRALEGQEQQLGADHPSTLFTVYNLAGLYSIQGHYGAAEPLYQRALAGRERKLGADHPDVLLTVNNLAELYERQGRIEEAEMTRDKAGRRSS
ncbi:TPR-like protein [Athelia psychrophila]|uniref:TPR-like protein n=1 Tax=Athelia psychrophila TaxID=1759441 RepID=A0A166INM2_9AGAM|nr:TPR-like protein [Fibularhizoctonia sp. CBS 109695]